MVIAEALVYATLFVGVGAWIGLSASLFRSLVERIERWQLRLILGEPHTEATEMRRERLIQGLVSGYVWGSRALGGFFIVMGVGIVIEAIL